MPLKGVVAWMLIWSKVTLSQWFQETLRGLRTEFCRPAYNMRLRTATPTAVLSH